MNFWQTIEAAKGPQVALSEMDRATAVIWRHVCKVDGHLANDLAVVNQVARFLDSEFGGYMAQDVLRKVPVGRQLDERPARFLKHFRQVMNRSASHDAP